MRLTFLALVNPAAGGGRCGRLASRALDRLASKGVEIEVRTTAGPGDATGLAREAFAEGRRHFLSVGGDGTAYEVLNGLLPEALSSDRRPVLGFLPLGTGNSFLRDFRDGEAETASMDLTTGIDRSCDVIRLVHDGPDLYCLNLFSLGFAADVNGLRARRFRSLGPAGYAASVVTCVAGLRPRSFPVRWDDGPWDRDPVTFFAFCNSRYTGGTMRMAPEADTADGVLDVVRVGPMKRFGLLRAFPKIYAGTHVSLPEVRTSRARVVEFDLAQPIDVMVDGEALVITPRRLEVLPAAIEVRV
ncbi:MAG: diacylglycerol kinase family lipid kinase [Deltaproteobacteria bacterium]|nr:diacylglycerol kinase family lipid kinase [Deltaproteobacteria bacterium]